MARSRLRIYYGPQGPGTTLEALPVERETVTVTAGEIFPLLTDAVRSDRTWLSDFEDDEITVSTDLYEMILAYQHYRRPSA